MVSLRSLREAHGLTSPQLAERIAEHGVPVDPDTLLNVELGHKKASRSLLTAWAGALGIKPVDIKQTDDLAERLTASPKRKATS